jgi:predicted nucleic-acid-binding Zn-ribbon protein
MNGEGSEITKCPKCGGVEIAKGRLSLSTGHYLSGMVFEPESRRFFTLNVIPGTYLAPESYACLGCGAVWSQTDPNALREFIEKHCKKSI